MTTSSGNAVVAADGKSSASLPIDDRRLRSLGLSVLLVSLPFGMLVLGLPLIARELGAGAVAIGGLFSVYALITVVVQPIVGHGLDRFGRRPFLIAGLLGFAVSNAAFGLASGVGGLYLAQLAQGVGSGLLWVAVLAVVSDLAPADCRGEEYGRVEQMAFRGILIGSLAGFALLGMLSRDASGGGLTPIGGWRVLFLGFSATTLAAAVIVWRGVPETLQHNSDHAGVASSAPKEQPTDREGRWRLPDQLRILLGIVVLTASATALLSPILIKHLNDNVSTNMFTLALAFLPAALVGALLSARLGGLSDRFGRRPPLIVALLVGGLAALAVPLVQSLWPLALLWVLETAAFAVAAPAEEALVVDLAGDGHTGAAFGYFTAAAGLGGVIGPLMGGWLYDRFAAAGAFGVSALLMAFGAVLILLFVHEPPHSNSPEEFTHDR